VCFGREGWAPCAAEADHAAGGEAVVAAAAETAASLAAQRSGVRSQCDLWAVQLSPDAQTGGGGVGGGDVAAAVGVAGSAGAGAPVRVGKIVKLVPAQLLGRRCVAVVDVPAPSAPQPPRTIDYLLPPSAPGVLIKKATGAPPAVVGSSSSSSSSYPVRRLPPPPGVAAAPGAAATVPAAAAAAAEVGAPPGIQIQIQIQHEACDHDGGSAVAGRSAVLQTLRQSGVVPMDALRIAQACGGAGAQR
jgi:hypothetical protein